MRALVQRVSMASVKVKGEVIGKIDYGMLLLVGFNKSDSKDNVDKMIEKILKLRIFDDENSVMNLAIDPKKMAILSVSQFTLHANTIKGNRPSYIDALGGDEAKNLYDYFNRELAKHIKLETGIFGADMEVTMKGDGPVTILLEK